MDITRNHMHQLHQCWPHYAALISTSHLAGLLEQLRVKRGKFNGELKADGSITQIGTSDPRDVITSTAQPTFCVCVFDLARGTDVPSRPVDVAEP